MIRNRVDNRKEQEMGDNKLSGRWARNVSGETLAARGVVYCGSQVYVPPGGYLPLEWVSIMKSDGVVMDAGFEEVEGDFVTKDGIEKAARKAISKHREWKTTKEVSTLTEKQSTQLNEYHEALTWLERRMPNLLKQLGFSCTVEELISRVEEVKLSEADSDGMFDRRDKFNGTFIARDSNPSVVRKRGGIVVGCDDQSGEDVCADADGWGRDGPR